MKKKRQHSNEAERDVVPSRSASPRGTYFAWYPADWLLDEYVAECLQDDDHVALVFYVQFLNRSFLDGGSMPELPPAKLAARLGMKPEQAKHGLSRALAAGKLRIVRGRLTHKRIASLAKHAEEKVIAARRAANARWNKALADDADAMRSHSGRIVADDADALPSSSKSMSKSKSKKNTLAASPAAVAEFEALWAVCEKKVGKGKARATYAALRDAGTMPDADEVRAAFCRMQDSEAWSKDERRYQPHLTTWLNREGWNDQPPTGGTSAYNGSGTRPSYPIHPDTLAALAERRRRREEEANDAEPQ